MSKEAFGISMETEIWRTKPEWKGYYEFSNWGRVRSLDRVVTYIDGRKRLHKGKVITPNKNGQLGLAIDGTTIYIQLSKIIAELFVDMYTDGMPISYKDNNPKNCRLDNLSIGINCYSSLKKLALTETHNNINGVPIIEGGFSEGQRILFDITLADKIGKPLGQFRGNNITPNLDNWEKGVDYIDLMEYANFNDYIPLLLDLGYSTSTISQSDNIFIFSERGTAKVMSSLHNSNPVKWEFLNNFVNEYFGMREQIKNQQNTLEQQKKDLLFAIYTGGQAGIIASKQLTELEVQEATAPLIDTIEKQKPKVEKYKEYVDSDGYITPRMAAQLLKLPHPTAQAFNKLLKEHRVQYKSGKNWVLYEDFSWMLKEGYCKQVPYIDSTGTTHYNLRWTPKGIDYISTNILDVT